MQYLGGRERAAVKAVSSAYRWVLSGTTPIASFAEIKVRVCSVVV